MYKKIHIGVVLTTVFCCTTLFAQNEHRVGINTETPERTLHVVGNLTAKTLENKSEDENYDYVLVANSVGDIDYITRAKLLEVPPSTSPTAVRKRVINVHYSTENSNSITGNVVTAGKFQFRFQSPNLVQFRVKDRPTNNSPVRVYTTFEQNWRTDGFEYESDPRYVEFTNAGWDTTGAGGWQPIARNVPSSAQVVAGEYNELYISYPNENEFYRVFIYSTQQSVNGVSQYDWIIACEIFGE